MTEAKADGETDINPWMPEHDLIAHQAIGKLGEEAAEVAGRCLRVLIQGLHEIDPDTKRTNREELSRELADIMANIQTVKRELDLDYSDERVNNKRNGYKRWFDKLRFLSAR